MTAQTTERTRSALPLLLVTLLCLAAGCTANRKAQSFHSNGAASVPASAELDELFEEYWEEVLFLDPLKATQTGDHRYDDRLANDISEGHREKQRELFSRYLGRLKRFQTASLNARDRLNRDVLAYELELGLEGLRFDDHLLPVNQFACLPVLMPRLGAGSGLHPFRSVRDYDNFLSRIRHFEVWVDTAIGNMRQGMARAVVQPKAVMQKVQPQLAAMIVSNVTQSVFYRPVTNFPADFTEADRTRLRRDYSDAITNRIIPTYARLHAFIRDEYLPKCRDTVGLSALPLGKDWYALRVREYTSTRLNPDEIFALGVREVERLRQEMIVLQRQTGVPGDLHAFAAHLEKTQTNAWRTKPELIAAYNRLRAKVEPQLPRLFKRMPAAPYEIRTVEEYREKSASSQYMRSAPDGSRPGIFYVNAAAISEKPVVALEALFLHEAAPGHHFETALQQEQAGQPRFRRFAGYPGYSEGWGLYCEGLGPELGCYTDPAQRMGWLSADMWRARRLVVDVGLHARGWSRERARQYLLENPFSRMSADLEVDRYIARPGQALAYKVGERTLTGLRAEATRRLGARFDLREFHDIVLGEGALPLGMLENRLQAWMNERALKWDPLESTCRHASLSIL